MSKTSDPKTKVKELSALPQPPAYALVLAPDRVRRDRIREILLKRTDTKNLPGLKKYSGDELSATKLAEFKDAVFSPSLFNPVQHFLIDDVEDLKAPVAKEIIDFLEKSSLSGISIIFSGSSLPTNSVFKKFFAKQDLLVELEELSGPELRKWVTKELERVGIQNPSPQGCEAILQVAEENPDKVIGIAEHMATYLDGKPLTKESVFEVYISEPDPDQFRLLESSRSAGSARAEVDLQTLVKGGKHPLAVLGLISRTILQYLVIQSGVPKSEGLKLLKLPTWIYDKVSGAARGYSTQRLRKAADAVVRADSKIKGKALGGTEAVSEVFRALQGK